MFELDCKTITYDINTSSAGVTNNYVILGKCLDALTSLSKSVVSFVGRQINHIAHILTKAARLNASSKVFNYIPYCIQTVVYAYSYFTPAHTHKHNKNSVIIN